MKRYINPIREDAITTEPWWEAMDQKWWTKHQKLIDAVENAQDEDELIELADSKDYYVRSAVAERTDNIDLLRKLAKDRSTLVRESVAARSGEYPELQAYFVSDPAFFVRQMLAKTTSDIDLLEKLAQDRRAGGGAKLVREAAVARMEELGY